MKSICNLCLKCSNFCNSVDETMKENLELIFINVELGIADCALICEECIQKVRAAIDLKSICIHNEDLIESYETDRFDAPDKLIEVYLEKNNLNCKFFPNQLRICRFCITLLSDHNFFLLADVDIDMNVEQTIKTHFPEVNLNISKNPVVCKECLEKLQKYGMFITEWLNIFKLKKLYCSGTGTDIPNFDEVCTQQADIYDHDSTVIKREFSTMEELESETKENRNVERNIQIEKETAMKEVECQDDGVQIKSEPILFVQLENDLRCWSDDSGTKEWQQRTEKLQFEPKLESEFIFKEEQEISIYDVKGDGFNLDEETSRIHSLLGNKNTIIEQTAYNGISMSKQPYVNNDFCKHKALTDAYSLAYTEGVPNSKLPQAIGSLDPKIVFERLNLEEMPDGLHTSYSSEFHTKTEQNLPNLISNGKDQPPFPLKGDLDCDLNQIKTEDEEHFEGHHSADQPQSPKTCLDRKKECYSKSHLTRGHSPEFSDYKTKNTAVASWITQSHKSNIYQCKHCDFNTKHYASYKCHQILHRNPEEVKLLKCSYCDFQSKHRKSISRHLKSHFVELILYRCAHCNYKTNEKNNLKLHLVKHSDKFYKCELCDFQTKHKYYMLTHSRRHSDNVNLHQCKFCHFRTKSIQTYKRHQIVHRTIDESELFKCLHCDFETKRKPCIKRHLRRVHSDDLYRFKCAECNYKTKDKTYLDIHCSTMHSDILYKCQHCNFETKHKYYLTTHLMKHSDNSDLHQCKLCHYSTKNRRLYKRHQVVHHNPEGIKLFNCLHCGLKTKSKQCVKRHLKRMRVDFNRYRCADFNTSSS